MQDTTGSASGQTRSTSEVRRNQVRQAQKVYHARKKEALQNLEGRVKFLEQTVEEMSKAMIALNDALVSSPAFRRQPDLVRRLEATLRHTLSLASEVHPSGEDEQQPARSSTGASTSPETTSAQSAVSLAVMAPTAQPLSALSGTSPLQSRQSPSIPLDVGISQSPEGGIVLRNPIASRLFPFFADWSTFALRLYWNTLMLAYTALDGIDNASLGPELFRYTLEYRPKEKILAGLSNMLNYMALTPERADGTIVVTHRPFHSDGSAGQTDAQESRRLLEQFLSRCDGLQTAIASNIEVGPEQGQRFLYANEVQSYMEERGCQVRQDSIVELPSTVSLECTEQQATQFAASRPQDQGQTSEALQRTSGFNPLSWHDSRVIFPEQEASQPVIEGGVDSLDQEMPTIQQDIAEPNNLISMDELIQQLSRISVCVGSGARYPARGIDATLDALVMDRLVF